MSNYTPRHMRRGKTKGGQPDVEKKKRFRRFAMDNKKWCRATFSLVNKERKQYNAWCKSIDSKLNIKRG